MRSSHAIREGRVNGPVPMYDEAVALLHTLCGPHGIRASASSQANYSAVFTRDAVMAGIAGLAIGDATITGGLVRTLEQLRELRGEQGQVPSNFTIPESGAPQVSFGSLVPRLDAPLWYVIGIGLAARSGVLDPAPYRASVERVMRLMSAIEYNGRHLIYVPVGGDWADEYIYEGYVLHDQVLRAWALRLAGQMYDEPRWRDKSDLVEDAIRTSFWEPRPWAQNRAYPMAAHTPARTYEMFDLGSCSLLAVSGLVSGRSSAALEWIMARFISRSELPPAFDPVIEPHHADWPALSRYHLHGFRNRPYEYHNGGVWMIWLGWLAVALAGAGFTAALERLRASISGRLTAMPYEFEEYFHGRTGMPGGTPHMAYSATGVILATIADRDTTQRLFER